MSKIFFSMWMSTRRFCLGRPSSICGTARTWTCAPSRRWWAATKPSAMALCWPRAAPPRNTASKPAKACLPPAPSARGIKVVPPDFDFYVQKSKAMIAIFEDYTPDVEQYSIDEAFLDMTGTEALFGPPLTVAHAIRQRIYRGAGVHRQRGHSAQPPAGQDGLRL